jgi:hypothetical protein
MSRPFLTILSLVGLSMAGSGIWLMFPQLSEIGAEAGVTGVPFIVMMAAGMIAGVMMALLKRYTGKGMLRFAINIAIGFILWGVAGAVYGVLTGDGAFLERPFQGRIIGFWFSALFLFVCIIPGMAGSFAAFTGSKSSMSAAVALLMGLSVISMVYSEVRFNTPLDQDLLTSLLTVLGLLLFVESMGMIRRKEDLGGGDTDRTISSRNIAFIAMFLVISLLIASLPFIIDPGLLGIYDLNTIYGKALIGLVLLGPLAILALARRRS